MNSKRATFAALLAVAEALYVAAPTRGSAQAGALDKGALPEAPLLPSGPRGVELIRSPAPPADARPAPPPPDARPAVEEAPQAPPTDFQAYAATSTGEMLPIFGRSLFAAPPSTFAPVEDVPVPAGYAIAAGDEVVIRAWGQVDIDVRAIVSRDGTIDIPRVGVVNVAGVPVEALGKRLRESVGRFYKNFELSVTLGRLRTIQIFVVGQASRPGLYTVSSLSTLMNALFASGGPAATGSMRRVELRRGEALVGTFDLYDLLLSGDKSKDLQLRSGDVIFVPPVGPLAAVAGRVKTPAVFELAGPASTLGDLLAHAGGVTTTADRQSLLLERLDQRAGRVVRELPWTHEALATPLRDGDVVTVRPVSQRFDNAVTLRGNVAFPLRTEWREGLRVSDLIPDRSVLIPERYWRRLAARAHEPASEAEVDRPGATLRGEDEGAEQIRNEVENLVEEVNWDYAVVERLDRATLEPRLLPFSLRKAVVERDPAHDLILESGDVVTILSQRDIASSSEKRTYFVRVEGEVGTPGFYQVRPGDTLRQLVERAGGLTSNAYLFGAEFTRESLRREQQARLDEIARRAEAELQRAGTERLARAGNAEEAAATRQQMEAQQRAIERLRTLRATGRLVLEVPTGARSMGDIPEITLEDGDRFYVPYRYSTVGVYGAVYNQTSFLHRPEKQIDHYLAQAGGPTRAADEGSTYVLRADGSVLSRRHSSWGFGRTRLMPNDAIVVPEEYKPTSWIRELKDWSQIFYQFGLGVAALTVLRP